MDDNAILWILFYLVVGIPLLIVAIPFAVIAGLVWLIIRGSKKLKLVVEARALRQQRLAEALAGPATNGKPEHRILALLATGKEVFTPEALLPGRVYRITIRGTYTYTSSQQLTGKKPIQHGADAFYTRDTYGNYCERHDGPAINGNSLRYRPMPHVMELSDRADHQYTFLIDGNGERLSIALRSGGDDPLGALRVDVELLGADVQTVASRHEEARHREAIGKIMYEIEKLRISTATEKNWGDPTFIADVVKSQTPALVQGRARIQHEFEALHARQPGLVAYMDEHEPALYARLMGPLEAFLAAERRDAKPRVVKPEVQQAPPRKRLTAEEIRERIIRRVTVVTGDQKAVLESVLKAWEEQAELLRQSGMEEEDITTTIGSKSEVLEEALGQLADSKESKGGRRATTRQMA